MSFHEFFGVIPSGILPKTLLCAVLSSLILSCGGGGYGGDGGSGGGGTPAQGLGPAVQYTTNNIRVGKTAIADLNGDGLKDAATIAAGGFGQVLLAYYQNTSAAFDAPVARTLSDLYIRDFALGDVNGDGAVDVVLSGLSIPAQSGYLGRVWILYQSPVDGTLSLPGTEVVVNSNNVGGVLVADLNSDSRDDIAVLAEWVIGPGMGNIAIFYQAANGTLEAESTFTASPVQYTGEVHAADMDQDGDNDLVLQTGLLQFGVVKQDSTLTPPAFSTVVDYYSVSTSYWGSFNAFSVGDLNGDGRNDVAVLDPGNSGYLNIFYQNTAGTLDGASLTPQPSSAIYGIEVADIDDDGVNEILGDLVNADIDPNTGGQVYVFSQPGTPPFSNYVIYSFGTISGGGSSVHEALSVGDVTGDGKKDVVVTWADEGLYVLPGAF
jgi:hypothetical protein